MNAERRGRPDPQLSRRALLLGAAGTVVTGGVVAYVVGRDDGGSSTSTPTSTPPSTPTSSAVSPPTTTAAPTSTAPAGTTTPATTPETAPATTAAPPVSDRVLVVLQLAGGNDALNTLVPLTGAYHDARPTLGLADDTLLALPGTTAFGLHPALAPLQPWIDAGRLGLLAGIGFDPPERSHFRSLDAWWSGRPTATAGPGWLGRWLDAVHGSDDPVLRAVALGAAVPALGAERATSVAVAEPDRFSLDAAGGPAFATAWAALSPAHAAARSASERFAAVAAAAGGSAADGAGIADPDSGGEVARALRIAAELIAAEPGTRVVHVSVGGFDTHADQAARHERLLADVAAGIAGFQAGLERSGHAERTLLITTSEFGRRIAENGSGGTDHGKAGVQLVVGSGVDARALAGGSGCVFGALDPADPVDGDLRPVLDPRSLYAVALDWLGGASGMGLTDTVLGGTWPRPPLVTSTTG